MHKNRPFLCNFNVCSYLIHRTFQNKDLLYYTYYQTYHFKMFAMGKMYNPRYVSKVYLYSHDIYNGSMHNKRFIILYRGCFVPWACSRPPLIHFTNGHDLLTCCIRAATIKPVCVAEHVTQYSCYTSVTLMNHFLLITLFCNEPQKAWSETMATSAARVKSSEDLICYKKTKTFPTGSLKSSCLHLFPFAVIWLCRWLGHKHKVLLSQLDVSRRRFFIVTVGRPEVRPRRLYLTSILYWYVALFMILLLEI